MGWLAINLSIGMAGGSATIHADRPKFYDFIGNGEEARHGAKRFSTEVLIQPRANDFLAFIRQLNGKIDDGVVKELNFLNENDLSVSLDFCTQVGDIFYRQRLMLYAHMGNHHRFIVSVIDLGFEDLNLFLGVQGSSSATDEFFGFSGEHRSTNDDNCAERLIQLRS